MIISGVNCFYIDLITLLLFSNTHTHTSRALGYMDPQISTYFTKHVLIKFVQSGSVCVCEGGSGRKGEAEREVCLFSKETYRYCSNTGSTADVAIGYLLVPCVDAEKAVGTSRICRTGEGEGKWLAFSLEPSEALDQRTQ